MHSAAPSHVPIIPIGAVSCATVLWRDREQLRLTAIVKATFAFAHDAPMRQVEPAPVHEADIHHDGNPARSIAAASDLAPFLPFADVVLLGHAHAPLRKPGEAVPLRLVVSRGNVVLDKTLHAVGDQAGGRLAPFERLPIVYERALGGLGHRDNPVGVGFGSDGRTANILDPVHPDRCAGFGPISRIWPVRRGMLTAEQRKALAQPIIEIPPGFDWSYFQAAPRDQRITYLRGDELILLEGMHPKLPQVRTQLPGAAGAAVLYGLRGGEPHLLPLVGDTLHIDADAERCSVTWRGNVAIPGEESLAGLRLAGGVSLPRAPVPWPADPAAIAAVRSSEPPRAPGTSTGRFEAAPRAVAPSSPTPLAASPSRPDPDEVDEEAVTATRRVDDGDRRPPRPPGAAPVEASMTMTLDVESGRAVEITEIEADPDGVTETSLLEDGGWESAEPEGVTETSLLEDDEWEYVDPPNAAPEEPFRATMTLEVPSQPRAAGRSALPFQAAPAPPAPRDPRDRALSPSPARIPGAPWAGEPAPPAPRASPELSQTIDLPAMLGPGGAPSWSGGSAPEFELPELVPPPARLAPLPPPEAPELSGTSAPPAEPDLSRPVESSPPPLLQPLDEEAPARAPLPPEPPRVITPVPVAGAGESPANTGADAAASAPPEDDAAEVWRKPEPQQLPPTEPSRPQARPSVKGDIYKKFNKR